jgi:hypothetical protein
MDAKLDAHRVTLRIERVRPLAFVKHIITMVLAVNADNFAEHHPELRAFVLERDRTGAPEGLQIYLVLYLGPIVRFLGRQGRANLDTHEAFVLSEVAYPPFSYIASFDEPSPLLAAGNITRPADLTYTTRATAKRLRASRLWGRPRADRPSNIVQLSSRGHKPTVLMIALVHTRSLPSGVGRSLMGCLGQGSL